LKTVILSTLQNAIHTLLNNSNGFLNLWEEYKLRVNENIMLRKIYGSMKDEVGKNLRILSNKEFCDLYRSPSTEYC